MNYVAREGLLNDKVVLVTGAGDGIGRVAAKTYGRFGATVILLGRTTSKLESLDDEFRESGFPEVGIVPMDLALAGPAEFAEMVAAIEQQYGRLDGLLHNAAMLGDRVPVETYDLNDWAKVMQVNFNSVVSMTRLLMPVLRKSTSASVVFTSSGVGATPRAYWGAYSVSKYALEGFAKLLADEMENTSSIRFNILNPGGTRTGMRASAYPNEDPTTLKTPEDLMSLYLYLMGEDSIEESGKTFTG